jgi:ribosomal protein S1
MTTNYVGRTVRAKVTRVEEYALYLGFEGIEIIVLVPDVSWDPTHLKEAWRVGDETAVKIIRYVEQERIYKGTMKDIGAGGEP